MPGEITQLLIGWAGGDQLAYERLIPMVYDELRKIAHRMPLHGRSDDLQPTAIVHELYLKLIETGSRSYENRLHFFALAAKAMRQILMDRNRMRLAAKREGDRLALPIHEVISDNLTVMGKTSTEDLLDLDSALTELERFDPRKARMVELRHFAGLKMEEIAATEKLSAETVRRELRLSEAWLLSYLRRA